MNKRTAKRIRQNNQRLYHESVKCEIKFKEHKCIWKGVYIYHQESTCYALSCGNKYFDNYMGEDVDIFKYCPYCGGEIELDKRYFDIAVNRTAFGEPEPQCDSVYDYYGVE